MKYQVTTPLDDFISRCKTQERKDYSAALVTSSDPALLTDAVEALANKLKGTDKSCQSFLNFCLNNTQDFRAEFQRMVYTLNLNAGFHNRFRGIVAVDLSEWDRVAQCKELDAALAYLFDTRKDRRYIFYAATEKTEQLRNMLNNYFSLDTIVLEMEKPMQIYSYTLGLLVNRYGVQLEDSGETGLYKSITQMMQEDTFDGVSSIHSYCRDFVSAVGNTLNAETISAFQKKQAGKSKQLKTKNDIGLIK